MKKFLSGIKKNIVKILVLIIIVQFVSAPASQATVGGVLFTPIQDLVITIGDAGEAVLGMVTYGSTDYAESVIKLTKGSNQSTAEDFKAHPWKAFFAVQTVGYHFIKYVGQNLSKTFSKDDFKEFIELPVMSITPDKIFSNEIPILNVNVINPPEPVKDDKGNTQESIVYTLQQTVSTWYVVLRNIAIVAMLSILVYVGIKIVISSAAEDKAKYKETLKDWVIGLCLIFLMHYGMSFMLELNNKIIDMLSVNNRDVILTNDSPDFNFTDFTKDMDDNLTTALNTYNVDESGNPVTDKLYWHTDMAGQLRFLAQTNIKSNSTLVRFGYTVMYVVLVIYTWMFFVKYLVRVLHITFLTLFAPMVAMAYPIDKMGDGSAQTFNSWVREYILTLLTQPMHMILYTILISSAMDLTVKHPIYGIVVFGVMLQSEKMIRKLFGFDKAPLGRGEGGSFAGAFTGSTVMHGLDRALHTVSGHRLPPPPGGAPRKGGPAEEGRIAYANNRTNDSNAPDVIGDVFGSGIDSINNDNNNNRNNQSELPAGRTGDNPGVEGSLPLGTQAATQEYYDYNNGKNIATSNDNNLDQGQQEYLDWNLGEGNIGSDTQNIVGNNSNPSGNENITSSDSRIEPTPTIRMASDNSLPQSSSQQSNGNVRVGQMNGNPYIGQTNNKKTKEKKKISKAAAFRRAYITPAAKYVGKKALKGGIRMATASFVGATGATLGIAAGLATDDMSNVFKYGAAGLTGGALAGDVIAKNAENGIPRAAKAIANNASKAHDNYELYKDTPKEYQDYLNKKSDEEYMNIKKNKDTYNKFVKEFGEQDAKEKMQQSLKYRQQGITDTDLTIKAMKLDSGPIGKTAVTSKERIAAAKLASGVSSAKDVNSMQERLEKKGYNKQLVKQNMEAVRKLKGLENN